MNNGIKDEWKGRKMHYFSIIKLYLENQRYQIQINNSLQNFDFLIRYFFFSNFTKDLKLVKYLYTFQFKLFRKLLEKLAQS